MSLFVTAHHKKSDFHHFRLASLANRCPLGFSDFCIKSSEAQGMQRRAAPGRLGGGRGGQRGLRPDWRPICMERERQIKKGPSLRLHPLAGRPHGERAAAAAAAAAATKSIPRFLSLSLCECGGGGGDKAGDSCAESARGRDRCRTTSPFCSTQPPPTRLRRPLAPASDTHRAMPGPKAGDRRAPLPDNSALQ